MSPTRIAITGGTGFVGKTLVNLATSRGLQVKAITRTPQKPLEGVEWITGALNQGEALGRLVAGVDAIVHLAGLTTAPDRAAFEAANVTGTLALIDAAKLHGVTRFIHISSLSAREPHLSDYGWSKARSEAVLQASGLHWTIVRPPAVFGPGDKDFLNLFKMAQMGFVMMPPKGKLSVIEVSDLARLLLALVDAPDASSQLYEPDDGQAGGWTHASFAKAIGWSIGKNVLPIHMSKLLLFVGAKLDGLVRRGNARLTPDRVSYMAHPDWVIDPARRPPPSLWEPEINTRSGLKATARFYLKHGWMA